MKRKIKQTPGSWFSHIAIECPGENTQTEWLEAVDDKDYPTENE